MVTGKWQVCAGSDLLYSPWHGWVSQRRSRAVADVGSLVWICSNAPCASIPEGILPPHHEQNDAMLIHPCPGPCSFWALPSSVVKPDLEVSRGQPQIRQQSAASHGASPAG